MLVLVFLTSASAVYLCVSLTHTVTVASKSPTRRDPSTSAKSPNDEKHNRETEKLNKQISRYREIIEQQEILIQVTESIHVGR